MIGRMNPYAPPRAPREAAIAEGSDGDLVAARARYRATEAHIGAIARVAQSVSLVGLLMAVIALRKPVGWATGAPVLLGLAFTSVFGLGAQRLRNLQSSGRLLVTLEVVVLAAPLLFAGPVVALAILAVPLAGLAYLWLGKAAHVLGAEHRRIVAATPDVRAPIAIWGWIVAATLASFCVVVALRPL